MAEQKEHERKVENVFAQAADLVVGAIDYSAEQVSKAIDGLVARGKISREEAATTVKEMSQRGKEERAKLQEKLKGAFAKLRLPSREEFDALKARVDELEKDPAVSAGGTDRSDSDA